MPNFVASQIGLSYPKGRELISKVIPVSRTDSNTAKCALPKDAVVVNINCYQAVAAGTAAATWTLGWAGNTSALLNAFSAGTTSAGLTTPGATTGSGVFTKLTQDQLVRSTFAGGSTSGGTGYVLIEYFLASAGEAVDD
jgi:hypothetical protein